MDDTSTTAVDRAALSELVDAGNARAPIRAEVEEVLDAFQTRINEQQKLINLIRQAMEMREG